MNPFRFVSEKLMRGKAGDQASVTPLPPCHIEKLPDENLHTIFEMVYMKYRISHHNWIYRRNNWSYLPIGISHVNRRFRAIMISSPMFWSRFSNAMDEQRLATYRERYRNANVPLIIEFKCSYALSSKMQNHLDLFREFLNQSEKWELFVFTIADDYYRTREMIRALSGLMANGRYKFPNLKYFIPYRTPSVHQETPTLHANRLPDGGLFENWSVPKLESIISMNGMWKFFDPDPPPVQTFSLDVSSYDLLSMTYSGYILSYIDYFSPMIRDLTLSFDWTFFFSQATSFLLLEFPMVTRFTLHVTCAMPLLNPRVPMVSMATFLNLPSLKRATVTIMRTLPLRDLSVQEFVGVYRNVLSPFGKAPQLNDITIIVCPIYDKENTRRIQYNYPNESDYYGEDMFEILPYVRQLLVVAIG